jgi:hypothetical protein
MLKLIQKVRFGLLTDCQFLALKIYHMQEEANRARPHKSTEINAK